jgi:hypothetical protein
MGFRKAGKTMALTAGNKDQIEAGKLVIGLNELCTGLLCKFAVTINKSDAGTDTLAAAEKKKLLQKFIFDLRYGSSLRRIPYAQLDGDKMREQQNYQTESEVIGYADTSTGLGKTIAASTDTAVEFGIIIPLGGKMRDNINRPVFHGMGQSQLKSVQLEISQISDLAVKGANITVKSGSTVTVTVYPLTAGGVKGERWSYIPEVKEVVQSNFEHTFGDGHPLLAVERTAVHASTVITEDNLRIGDTSVVEQASPKDFYNSVKATGAWNAAADLSDRVTVLYALPGDRPLEAQPSGPLFFGNPKQELASYKLMALIAPVAGPEEVAADIEWVAKNARNTKVTAISLPALEERSIPSRLAPFQPMVIFSEQDSESRRYPGLQCGNGDADRAAPIIPDHIRDRARATISDLKGRGLYGPAEDVVKEVSRQIPGAVPGSRGFASGSSIINDRVKATLGL